MHFGSKAIFTDEGLIVSSGMTSALGIRDGSRCWGTWVRDARGTDRPPHFLLSPIPPRCWLRAFRIDLKIAHEKEAMSKAAAALKDQMNILFAECAPSGHHHATWNIVAEITSGTLLEESEKVRKQFLELKISEDEVRNAMVEYVEHVDAAIQEIEATVDQANTRPGNSFLYRKSEGSLLYGPNSGYAKRARRRYTRRVEWMEALAVFTAYAKLRPDEFVRFVFDKKDAIFKSQGIPSFVGTMGVHARKLARNLPATTIVSLDLENRTIRASLSQEDIDRRKISVRIPYRIARRKLGGDPRDDGRADARDCTLGSQGLLQDICSKFNDMNLLQVTNLISNDEEEEEGTLNFLAFPENGRFADIVFKDPGTEEQAKAILKLKREIEGILENRGSGNVRPPTVALHDTFQMFVSSKQFLWKRREDIYPRLQSLAGRYGFRLSRVSDEEVVRTYDGKSGHHINDQVMRKIESCDAILQLWPRAAIQEDEEVYQWLHWELGLALGQKKLAIVCFDTIGHGTVPNWAKDAPQTLGLFHHEFDSGVDADQIMVALEPGIAYAAARLRRGGLTT